jgi:hypothetical protein
MGQETITANFSIILILLAIHVRIDPLRREEQDMAIGAILTHADYTRTMDQIRRLQAKLDDLAHHKGNLHPEGIAVSQQIDD